MFAPPAHPHGFEETDSSPAPPDCQPVDPNERLSTMQPPGDTPPRGSTPPADGVSPQGGQRPPGVIQPPVRPPASAVEHGSPHRPPIRRTSDDDGPSGPLPPAPTAAAAPRPRSRVAAASLAFLLGGMVGAGGFALGARSGDEAVPVATTTAPISDLALPVNPVEEAGVDAAPDVTTDTLGAEALEPAAAVAASLGPSVVQVETDLGQGSGVVYAEGLILTNHHVVTGATTVSIRAADGRVFDTEVLGSDPRNDIAVLSAPGADLPVAAIGEASALLPGQVTVAIGSPFQLQQTVTAGIVSSVNRPVPNGDGSVTAMIQTDAPINPGNSGGALANRLGEVVGINTSIRTDGTSNSNVGIGFAVPIETAIEVAERIEAGESLEPGVLGVVGSNEDADLGVAIVEVVDGSAAAAAGIQSGDRVLSIDGVPVTTIAELAGLIQSNFTGEQVELEIVRGVEELTVQATLS